MSSALSVSNVVKSYQNYKALDDVSFEVPTATIFGLLGPNGAGKTTLIRIINKIIGPDEGTVKFGLGDYKDMTDLIGYLPEERGLYKKMKVGEQLLYLAQLKGLSKNEAKKRIEIWFERLEIAGWWNKIVEELSKGMQQKIQFISTVVHEPKLVILDEPFSGFDPINAELIKNEVLRLNKEGTTFILSTHRMESVEQLCNNLVMINKSKVVLHGSVNQVRKDFKENVFEISYEGNVDWSGFDAHELENTFEGFQRTKVKNQEGSNCNAVISRLMENNALIHEIKEVIPSMNDIFIKVVKG